MNFMPIDMHAAMCYFFKVFNHFYTYKKEIT